MDKLIKAANDAREKAYAPYSNFTVGAAVLTADGRIYTGCNIENASYPVGICAERVAMSKAVSEGSTDMTAIAVMGGPAGQKETDFCPPCGMCRQFMREFAGDDFRILLAKTDADGEITDRRTYEMEELLVDSFGKE